MKSSLLIGIVTLVIQSNVGFGLGHSPGSFQDHHRLQALMRRSKDIANVPRYVITTAVPTFLENKKRDSSTDTSSPNQTTSPNVTLEAAATTTDQDQSPAQSTDSVYDTAQQYAMTDSSQQQDDSQQDPSQQQDSNQQDSNQQNPNQQQNSNQQILANAQLASVAQIPGGVALSLGDGSDIAIIGVSNAQQQQSQQQQDQQQSQQDTSTKSCDPSVADQKAQNNAQPDSSGQQTVTVTTTVTSPGSLTTGAVAQNAAAAPPAIDSAAPTFSPNGLMNITTSSGQILVAGPNQMVVAPKKGDLRFVPFSIDAAVGNNVTFAWGAGPHTATQSSALEVCNKSANGFDSGKKNAGEQFPITIADENPIWVYCAIPTHCQKGMFGLINPPKTNATKNTLATYLKNAIQTNKMLAQMMSDTMMMTANSPAAAWGADFDMTKFPVGFHNMTMENVLLTRQFFAANPQLLSMNSKGQVVNNAAGVSGTGTFSSTAVPDATAGPTSVNADADVGTSASASGQSASATSTRRTFINGASRSHPDTSIMSYLKISMPLFITTLFSISCFFHLM